MEYSYVTKNTCCKLIKFNLENNIIKEIEFLGGGCPGNLQALSKLVKGMTVDEVTEKLSGIMCGTKGTSCADQLAKALKEVKEKLSV